MKAVIHLSRTCSGQPSQQHMLIWLAWLILTSAILVFVFAQPSLALATQPAINQISPTSGQMTPWHRPTISVQISGSDIDASSIILKLNDQPVQFVFDPISGNLSYTPIDYLSTGTHTLYLSVSDTTGLTSIDQWAFSIGNNFPGALFTYSELEIEEDAYIAGDTYSLGDTDIYGSPTIAGNGYATGLISWNGMYIPYLGMAYSNVPARDFPVVDFDYYKSLAEAEGKVFSGKLHITKKKPQTGVVFVDGDLKVSSGDHNMTAVVTGEVKITGNANISTFIDSLLIIGQDKLKISGHPTLQGVIYSQGEEQVRVTGSPSLSGAIVARGELKVEGEMTVIDTLAPEPPLLNQPVSPVNDTIVHFTGTAEADSIVEIIEGVQIVATDTAGAAGLFNIPVALTEGSHTVMAVAIDTAGNVSELSQTRQVTVDLTPPTVGFISPSPGVSLNGTVTIEATAADDFDLEKIEFYADNQLLDSAFDPPYLIDWDTSSLSPGSYELKAVSFDTAGNTAESTISVEVGIDMITPLGGLFTSDDGLVTLDFPPGAVSENVIITYDRTADTSVTGFSYSGSFFSLSAETAGGTPVNVFSVPFTLTVNNVPSVQNLDLYSFNFVSSAWQRESPSTIAGGNLIATLDHMGFFALLADTEAPTTVATLNTSAAPSGWRTADTTITLSATDSGSGLSAINYQWDSTQSAWQTYASPVAAQEGSHTLYFYSDDLAGNSETIQTLNIKVDTKAPSTELISPTSGEHIKGISSVQASAEDTASGIESVAFLINDATLAQDASAPYGFSLDTSGYADGEYTLLGKATDIAGNESTASVNFYIDNTAPTIISVFPANGDTSAGPNTDVSVEFSEPVDPLAVNTTSFYLSDAGGAIIPAVVNYNTVTKIATLTPLSALIQGMTYTTNFTGMITDMAGNSLADTSFTFTVPDLTAPQTVISQPGNHTVLSGVIQSITGTAFDNMGIDSVRLKISRASDGAYWDGATWATTSTWVSAVLEDGTITRAFSYMWNLPGDDALDSYTINAQAVDSVGLADPIPPEIQVYVDNIGPSAAVLTIDGGAGEIVSLNVTLDSSVAGAAYMRFAESTVALAGSSYLPYQASYDYEFTTQATTKTIFGQYKDEAGNESQVVSDNTVYKPQIGSEDYFTIYTKEIGGKALEVNLVSGNLVLTSQDLQVAARGISNKIARTYNSLASTTGAVSPGWVLNTMTNIIELPDGTALYTDSDGTRHVFTPTGGGAYSAPSGVNGELSKGATFVLTDKSKTYNFNSPGQGEPAFVLSTTKDGINQNTFSRQSDGTLTSIGFPSGGQAQFAYTGGLLASITDPLSRAVAYTYDNESNLESFTSSGSRATSYGYNAGKLVAIADINGTISISYDAKGRVKTITDPRSTPDDQIVTTLNYYPGKTTVDTAGKSSDYFYNLSGNPTKIVDENGNAENNSWLDNRLISQSGASGSVLFGYDSSGNVTDTSYAVDNETTAHTSAVYSDGKLTAYADADGNNFTFSRQSLGTLGSKRETVRDSRGFRTTRDYDEKGNLVTQTDWHSSGDKTGASYGSTYYGYSDDGDYLRFIADPSGGVTSFGYDAMDNSWQVIGARGYDTWFFFDDGAKSPMGESRILKTKDFLLQETTYSYDGGGNLTGVKNARNNITEFEYNAANLLAEVTDPLGRATSYSYDTAGRPTTINRPSSQSHFNYDDAGRLLGLSSSTSSTTESFDLTYFSGTENIKSAVGPSGDYQYKYNKANWLTDTTDPFGFRQTYSYTPGGQVTGVKLGGESTASYSYQDNLLISLEGQAGQATFSYDNRRNLTDISRQNDTSAGIIFDKANRVTEVSETLSGESISALYQYDLAGNMTTETLDGGLYRYIYDGLDRLISWAHPNGTVSYTYDQAGNLTSKGAKTYTYDEANQLISDGDNTYAYDGGGNLTSDGANDYTWNGAGRLASFTSPAGRTDYTYDFLGRRLTKTLPIGQTIKYHWLGTKLVAESNDTGTIATYTYTDKGRLYSTNRSGQTYFYHLSARGDVLALTDSTGQVVARYSYDPWGMVVSAEGPLAAQPFRYASYYFDQESEMYYLMARYYRPDISRFISRDPVPGNPSEPVSFNGYVYAGNNPLIFIDKSGEARVAYSRPNRQRLSLIYDAIAPPRVPTSQPSQRFRGLFDPFVVTGPGPASTIFGSWDVGSIFDQENWPYPGGPDEPDKYKALFIGGKVWGPHTYSPIINTYSINAKAGHGFAFFNHQLIPNFGHQVVMGGPAGFNYGGGWGAPPNPPLYGKYFTINYSKKYNITIAPSSWTVGYPFATWLWYKGLIIYTADDGLMLKELFQFPEQVTFGEDYPKSKGGDPVDTATGNFDYGHEDLKLPGKGNSIQFARSYNSQDARNKGVLGHGWGHSYDERLLFESATTITVMHGDGQRVKFSSTDTTNFYPEIGVKDKLIKHSDNSFTLIFADQTKYGFDSSGRLVTQIDRFDNATTLTYGYGYNGAYILARVTDSTSRTLEFTYDFYNRLTKLTDSAGRSVTYDYNSSDNLIRYTDARGKTTNYTYDSNHQLTGMTEPGATKPVIQNFYEDGKVIRQLDAFDTTYTYSYDTANSKTTLVDNRGNTLIHEYDDKYRFSKSTDPLLGEFQYVFGELNKPLEIVDQNNFSTKFSYDAGGNTTQTIDPEGHTTQASYDLANNNLLWAKDALNRQTTYTYDTTTSMLLESVSTPIGTALFDYYTDGLIKFITDDNSHTTGFEYNSFGNLSKVIDATDASTTMEYDTAGHMISTVDAEGNETTFAYDANGNILSIADPLAQLFPVERHRVDFTYDDRGNQDSFKDANNNLTKFIYDDMNSLTNVVDAHEATTTYGFDANYNLESVTDAEEHVTTYGYDVNDRLKSITDATSKTVEYRYDPVGNLTKIIYPNGNERYNTYYKDNFLKTKSYKTESTSYTFTYNPTHTLNDVTDDSSTTVFSYLYDDGKRMKKATDKTNSTYGNFVIRRAYDGVSNLTGLKAPNESTTTYAYNNRDDLIDIDIPGALDIAFGYDKARRRTAINMPAGVTNTFDFDAANRVATATIDTSSGSQSFVYTHDSNGNIIKENNIRYGYDALNRLTDWYNPLTDTTTTYDYDKVGNLLEVQEGSATINTFTYNSANQISSSGFSYDDNGNMTEAPTSLRGSEATEAISYEYDSENRLKEAINKDTSQTIASYTYGYMGRRTSSTDASGATTFYHYDGWNVVAESDASGTITANYYYDTDDEIMAMKRAGQTYYYQFNAHGDVVSLTDSSGTVVNTYTYDPWGSHLTTSETVSNPFRYAGYRWDEETGLYYLRARYYSAGIGRFFTKEPLLGELSDPPVHNAYMYAQDNPVIYVDPSGLKCKKSFWQRSWDNFVLTNETIPGLVLPLGSNALATKVTNGHFFKINQSPTPWQWARSGFTPLETGVLVAKTAGTQYLLLGASFEVGIGIGSMISAAILPCEQANSYTTGSE